MTNKWKRMLRRLAVAAALAVALAGSASAQDDANKKLVVILVDETSSFVQYWQESLDYAAAIVQRLGPDDAFAVIGIDDHGGDPDDARIVITAVDPSPLRAIQQKRFLAAQVRALQRRPAKRDLSDILGAIRQAALFANGMKGYRPVLAIFSDMDQTPRAPTLADAAGIRFPAGTEAHCFYVNASEWMDRHATTGGKSWDAYVGRWVAIFNEAGVKATKDDFYQKGQARAAIVGIFPQQ